MAGFRGPDTVVAVLLGSGGSIDHPTRVESYASVDLHPTTVALLRHSVPKDVVVAPVAVGRWMTHNSPVNDDQGDGFQPQSSVGPSPVPEFIGPASTPITGADTVASVTDEDRQQYGRLLDSALERGLLGQYDYEIRLSELATAPTLDELKRIVTELPVFAPSDPMARSRTKTSPRGPGRTFVLSPPGVGAGAVAKRRSNPWTTLIIMVAVIIVAFVFLVVYAGHLVHGHNGASGAPAAVARMVTILRL
jgi:Domain of unknown function (DUF1707)